MKILLATPLYPPEIGGPATYANLLISELPKHGIEPRLLAFSEVRRLPKLIRHLAYFFKCLWYARGVDAVYALDPVSVGFPAALAALVLGKKFLLRVPGDYAWEQGRQRFGVTDEIDEFQIKKYGSKVETLRKVQEWVSGRAVKIVVPSEYMRRIVSTWVNEVSKVEVIYSSIQVPPNFELPQDRPAGFLVVTMARRVPWKGIEALEAVVTQEEGWSFKLVTDMPHAEAMGWVKAADVFVLNSTYEGLSHALVEAMSLGTPVVATNVGGNPELVANGSEGVIIPPKDNEALYSALKEIEAHPVEARARAERAQARAQDFSIHKTIDKLVTLLKSV